MILPFTFYWLVQDLGFENSSIWLVSISQKGPLERLYTATFSAYVTANKIAGILRTLRGGVRQDSM